METKLVRACSEFCANIVPCIGRKRKMRLYMRARALVGRQRAFQGSAVICQPARQTETRARLAGGYKRAQNNSFTLFRCWARSRARFKFNQRQLRAHF